MKDDLLFVYGSLLDGNNEFGRYLMHKATQVGQAFFKGRLYDCGEYPGAVADSNIYNIKGRVYLLKDAIADLKILDDYEGFGIDQEQPNLFIRELITITCNNHPLSCWVYFYNLSVDGLKEITSGDYADYLNK